MKKIQIMTLSILLLITVGGIILFEDKNNYQSKEKNTKEVLEGEDATITYKNDGLVKMAKSSTPSSISDVNSNELEVAEKDWWIKAIKADEAWNQLDKEEGRPVNVGVLETGRLGKDNKDIADDDLKQDWIKVNNKDGDDFNITDDYGNKVNDNHGRWVTNFIVADENIAPKNFRGIADDVAKVKYKAFGSEIYEYKDERSERKENSISEPYIFSMIKTKINDGAKIINLSFGTPLRTKEAWKENKEDEDETYAAYEKAHKENRDEISVDLIIAMDDFLSERNDDSTKATNNDFLIIQGAGNGKTTAKVANNMWYFTNINQDIYRQVSDVTKKTLEYNMKVFKNETDKGEKKSKKTATLAKNIGYFANINQDTYKQAGERAQELDYELKYKLDDILSHIIIVGGAKPNKDKDGYESPEWASYGHTIDIVAPAEYLFMEKDEKPIRGTSFAAPMVSGAAALVWAHDSLMKAGEVKDRLLNSAIDYVVEVEEKSNKRYYPMLNTTAFMDNAPNSNYLKEDYNELIETYRKAIREQWNQDKLDKMNLGPKNYEPKSLSKDYGYELRDINNNGIEEMILGSNLEDGRRWIDEIYTIINEVPVKVFASEIRLSASIYKDGTIETLSGADSTGGKNAFYNLILNEKRPLELQEGYTGAWGDGPYNSLMDSGYLMNKEELKDFLNKYKKIGIIEHSFTPFVSEENLSDEKIEEIVADNLNKIEPTLLDGMIVGIFNKYYDMEDESRIWKSNVDPNHLFYQEAYDVYYPELKGLVTKEGMESIIKEMLFFSLVPTNPSWTFGPSYELEVLSQDSEHFKVKLSKAIGEQDSKGIAYYVVHELDYIKEDDNWKFAGAENINKNNYPL